MRRAHELGFRIVQVGVRAYSRAEQALFDDERITVFEWGARPPAVETIASAIGTEEIYITLDVDGLDPSVMPATGTPVPGGLTWYYTLDLLKEITRGRRVVGADVVEVAPRAGDVAHRVRRGAADLLACRIGALYALAGLALLQVRRLLDLEGEVVILGDQVGVAVQRFAVAPIDGASLVVGDPPVAQGHLAGPLQAARTAHRR